MALEVAGARSEQLVGGRMWLEGSWRVSIMASAQSSCFGVLTLPTFTFPFTVNPFVPKIITEHFPNDTHSVGLGTWASLDKSRLGHSKQGGS